MIVLMHTDASWDHADPSSILNASLCWTIPTAARATFYFIAGYLFFAGRDTFGPSGYLKAMRRKFIALLVPYIIWTLIGHLCAVAVGRATPDIGFFDLKALFWANGTNRPEPSLLGYDCVPLGYPGGYAVMWYVRNLMIMMVLSPLIWMLTRALRLWILPLLAACVILHVGLPGIENRTFCYFTLGASLAICGIDPTVYVRRHPWLLIAAWSVLCVIGSAAVYNYDINHILNGPKTILLRDLTAFAGVFALFAIASLSLRPRGHTADNTASGLNRLLITLAPAGFFIYVVNPLAIIEQFYRATDPLVPERWQTTVAFIYFTAARLTLIPLLYFALQKIAPRTLAFLTGGRAGTPRHDPETHATAVPARD